MTNPVAVANAEWLAALKASDDAYEAAEVAKQELIDAARKLAAAEVQRDQLMEAYCTIVQRVLKLENPELAA